jgi:hypothetical protein
VPIIIPAPILAATPSAEDTRPNTDLTVIVTDANGVTTTLDSHASDPAGRPQGIAFGTQLGHGFNTGGYALTRRIDRDNIDHGLLHDVKFVGANGETAYESFIAAMPRSMDADGHTLSVGLAGYMATAALKTFSMIFVDRDLGAWRAAATNRRVDLLSGAFGQVTEPSVSPDSSGRPTLRTGFTGAWTAGKQPMAEAWYDAGPGSRLGRITANWTRAAIITLPDANWSWKGALCEDDRAVAATSSANLAAAGPGTLDLTADGCRFAVLQAYYSTAAGSVDGAEHFIDWSDVAVYGAHDLPLLGDAAPYGVTASDVIRWLVANHCPQLNADGVQQTTYPISQLAFREHTKPFDAMLKVNSYHLWNLAVWEDRTVHYGPSDPDAWDWEIRHDEVGNQIGLQGDEYTQLRNGIVVQYTDSLTGRVEELLPEDHAELRDESLDNPYNVHGWPGTGDPLVVPFPCTQGDARELGRLQLLEDNTPKAPGSFTVAHHIRDRAGNLQPVWMVRAGQRVRLTSSAMLSDRPRLIHETSYSHDGRSLTISVDGGARMIEAYFDRVSTALSAANLQ